MVHFSGDDCYIKSSFLEGRKMFGIFLLRFWALFLARRAPIDTEFLKRATIFISCQLSSKLGYYVTSFYMKVLKNT